MTLRITPFPEPRAVPEDADPDEPRRLSGLSADLPASGSGGGLAKPHSLEVVDLPGAPAVDPTLGPIIERLSQFKNPGAERKTEPFPPVEPPAPAEPATTFRKAEETPEEPRFSDPPPPPEPQRRRSKPEPRDEAEALEDAFAPIVEKAVQSALYGPRESLHTYLEPMLRQTVRRAIAEQLESSRLFGNASLLDRILWRLQALVSSKTYEEIVFERTNRYQVEELYLFSQDMRRLLSYASHDPAQHGSPRRVRPTVRVLRARIGDLKGKDEHAFDLPLGRLGLIREGKHTLLVAVLRGRSNSLIRADLDFLQFQIEERYGKQLRDPQNVFMHTLQPLLEGGLLIQAPPVEP